MKFFKPKFACNKQSAQAPQPQAAAVAAASVDESVQDLSKSQDTTQSTDKQQPVSKSLPSSTATAADSVDAVTQPPVNASGKKESEAACAMITLSTSGDQHPATRKPTVPNVTSVDLDDGVDEQLLSDGGEEADDECEEESKSAPTLASGADGRVGGKYGSVMTLFQRKRPVHHQQQHQQQQQQQQQHLQNLQQQVASNASLQAKRMDNNGAGLRTMRMRDLIYWCPKDQPPPKWRRESGGQQSTGSLMPTADNSAAAASQQQQQQQAEPQSSVKTESTTAARMAPQVMLDSRGNIVLNEESLYIRESAPAIVEEVREDCAELRATYRSFRNVGGRGAATRGRQWSCKETLRFYKAVSTIGTDFSYMASLFKGRSREELKRKYKREEKANPHLIDQMLKKRKHYDLSMFELSSDSDTGADAKSNSGSVSGQKAAKFGSGGGQAAASKPSDIVMEGLKRHLQLKNSAGASSKKQQQQKQVEQQDQTVTVVI
ncbi:hypothetical protein BOX15_Mlig028140g3 [Macrostomum lignano]|uniref:Transcription factor TFIIIB component B'' Myb domain-containing protein n=2 Tax=Macrostomum lignano TaxID=282301 RepID=A0A267DT01_9PLAT|nr:hypothetical protein BOX15_Mlig028140g3 [Macrostomum lignano]